MIIIGEYIASFPLFASNHSVPWDITINIEQIIRRLISSLDGEYIVKGEVAIHRTAVKEDSATIKPPAIIGPGCFIGNHSLLRGGVYLVNNVKIGPGCEIKASVICSDSTVAHFNYIGDSLIGSGVNMEAGAVIANHYNERSDKRILVTNGKETIDIGIEKFGALVGDRCKIGANAVLSPGTVLKPDYVVRRLQLIEQT